MTRAYGPIILCRGLWSSCWCGCDADVGVSTGDDAVGGNGSCCTGVAPLDVLAPGETPPRVDSPCRQPRSMSIGSSSVSAPISEHFFAKKVIFVENIVSEV